MPEVESNEEKIYLQLQRRYLTVFLLASFVDWLQGPYLYRVYTSYGYNKIEISYFYITGFASSALFGILVGNIADRFGRKKLCLVYFLSTIITCISIIFQNSLIFVFGRIFGGISSAILYSTFESWYIGQHISYYKLNKDLTGSTFSKSTFYSGIIAILSGFISSIFSDIFGFGPTAPFLFSIPISIASFILCASFWEESTVKIPKVVLIQGLNVILFSRKNKLLIELLIIQTIFETVLYIFVFLWTPILEPINPNYGFIFGGFMAAIALGSYSHFILEKYVHLSREIILCFSIILALFSIATSTLGIYLQAQPNLTQFGTIIALLSFFFFEFSVGMYYPALSYIRGILVPESYRASVVSWFRLPSNFFICLLLLYLKEDRVSDNFLIFASSAMGLVFATVYSIRFIQRFSQSLHKNINNVEI